MQHICLDSYINGCLCFLNTTKLHKTIYTINIDLVVEACMVARQQQKMYNGLILSLKF